MKIKSLEEISSPCPSGNLRSLTFSWGHPQDEVLKIMPVQKQIPAGQWASFKAFVVIGDYDECVGPDVNVLQGGSHCHPWGPDPG